PAVGLSTKKNMGADTYHIAKTAARLLIGIIKWFVGEWGEGRMKYKCIKEMCLPKCDGDGFEIPNEYGFVTVGSIWERDDRGNLIGGDVHMDSLDDDSDFGWIEMPLDDLKENFALIE
ncbi:MAG: hypothetical protein HFI79_10600, partial [Lachnospiraceae bacterium]|nr:hypothetical protein [Lachnospiraceae bacterium]